MKIIMEFTVNRKLSGKITIVQQIDPITDEVVNEFYSTTKAAKLLGHPQSYSDIAKCCKGLKKIVLGYKWRYEKINVD